MNRNYNDWWNLEFNTEVVGSHFREGQEETVLTFSMNLSDKLEQF